MATAVFLCLSRGTRHLPLFQRPCLKPVASGTLVTTRASWLVPGKKGCISTAFMPLGRITSPVFPGVTKEGFPGAAHESLFVRIQRKGCSTVQDKPSNLPMTAPGELQTGYGEMLSKITAGVKATAPLGVQSGQRLSLPSWITTRRPFFQRDCEDAIKAVAGHIPATVLWDQFLDIGCGGGDLTRNVISKSGGRCRIVVATEPCKEVVHTLRRNAAQRGIMYEYLDIEKDVTHALTEWGKFRRIFTLFHMDKVKDKEAAFANVRNLLLDNGDFLLLFVARSNLQFVNAEVAASSKWCHYAEDFEDFMPKPDFLKDPVGYVSRLLEKVGMKVGVCDTLEGRWTFETKANLKNAVIASSPFLYRIPIQQRGEFVEDCVEMAVKGLPKEDGEDLKFSYRSVGAYAIRAPEARKQFSKEQQPRILLDGEDKPRSKYSSR